MAPIERKRVVLVTGGNSGIGFWCAQRLAQGGYGVVIASRDRELSEDMVARIRAETGSDAVIECGLDLASLASVRALAAEIKQRELPLHAVICNAGIQVRSHRPSAEGHELTFAVNHLGHFLLVHLLLERLLAATPSRILVVSSGVHDEAQATGMPKPQIPDMDALASHGGPRERPYNGRLAYVNSKLCNLWFCYELVRRLEARELGPPGVPCSVNAFEPGLVPGSGLARDYPAALRLVWDRVLPVLTRFTSRINTAEVAGTALADLLTEPALDRKTGRYFPSHTRFREAPSSAASYEEAPARALWEKSVALCGLTPQDSPAL